MAGDLGSSRLTFCLTSDDCQEDHCGKGAQAPVEDAETENILTPQVGKTSPHKCMPEAMKNVPVSYLI